MGFPYDGTGVQTGYTPAPPETYWLEVVDATDRDKDGNPLSTKKEGLPMVKCKLKVADGTYAGKSFLHWVTFLPKERDGAGMALNFLKHIGEPWEGQFDVTPENWIGKKVRAKLKVEEGFDGVKRNAIQYLVDETTVPKPVDDDSIPF